MELFGFWKNTLLTVCLYAINESQVLSPHSFKSDANSSCFIIRTPRFIALLSLLPAFSPAITANVLEETEEEHLPPSRSIAAEAVLRSMLVNVPVRTKVLPEKKVQAAAVCILTGETP